VPEPAEYVANGAARQAAWALTGGDRPPLWPAPPSVTYDVPEATWLLDRYGEAADRVLDRPGPVPII
jgi:xylulokinase